VLCHGVEEGWLLARQKDAKHLFEVVQPWRQDGRSSNAQLPLSSSSDSMRLAALVPTIPLDFVETLEKSGIRTDTELLFSGTAAEIFKRLPPETVSLHELVKYIALVTERAAAPGIRADILLSQESLDCELTSGVAELDRLLGGFTGSHVFEISGDKGSGKSVRATTKAPWHGGLRVKLQDSCLEYSPTTFSGRQRFRGNLGRYDGGFFSGEREGDAGIIWWYRMDYFLVVDWM
jgi:hypothetical protein